VAAHSKTFRTKKKRIFGKARTFINVVKEHTHLPQYGISTPPTK